MKTKLFFFAMFASVAASAQVTNVTPIGANYTDKTVSFRIWWNAGSRDATHLSKVWVWVDYIAVNSNNTTSGNSWARAAVSAASPAASVTYDGSNRQGFWLQGNSGSYSATVTVQLNISASKFNGCAYVSDYPPNAASYSGGSYTFKGTKPFIVNGTTINDDKYAVTTITSLTDATGCPGGVGRDEPHNNGECLPHLTVVGSYCRDLTDDNAISACNLEWKKESYKIIANYSSSNHECPIGWRPAMYTDFVCMLNSGLVTKETTGVAADVLDGGWDGSYCCAPGNSRWRFQYYSCSSNMANGCCGMWCIGDTGVSRMHEKYLVLHPGRCVR
ncbi:MAG: hypothetical protein LBU42_06715 [Prevotellaceae bacterium]|jgi:hypothetical protein|nr:hypothetical protein [Prevotellaceae bacterium]